MILRTIEDFVIPTLQSLDALNGEAWLVEVEDEFFRRFSGFLDPDQDWQQVTPNHNKPLWRDYCGSRVSYHYLKPNGYITIERHGNKGSIWRLTPTGRELIKSQNTA